MSKTKPPDPTLTPDVRIVRGSPTGTTLRGLVQTMISLPGVEFFKLETIVHLNSKTAQLRLRVRVGDLSLHTFLYFKCKDFASFRLSRGGNGRRRPSVLSAVGEPTLPF